MLLFCTPWKHQKTCGFLGVYSGGLKGGHCPDKSSSNIFLEKIHGVIFVAFITFFEILQIFSKKFETLFCLVENPVKRLGTKKLTQKSETGVPKCSSK